MISDEQLDALEAKAKNQQLMGDTEQIAALIAEVRRLQKIEAAAKEFVRWRGRIYGESPTLVKDRAALEAALIEEA